MAMEWGGVCVLCVCVCRGGSVGGGGIQRFGWQEQLKHDLPLEKTTHR